MSAFVDIGTIPPQQVWEHIVARTVHGERLTLAVIGWGRERSPQSTAT